LETLEVGFMELGKAAVAFQSTPCPSVRIPGSRSNRLGLYTPQKSHPFKIVVDA
jgi:hypothetical protein